MKWKLYVLCSWYNIMLIAVFYCLGFYMLIRESSVRADDLLGLLLVFTILSTVAFKNWMGIKFCRNIREKIVHRDRFGLLFYILWLINLVLTIIFLLEMYDELVRISLGESKMYGVLDYTMTIVTIIAIPTLTYTIFFDIPLERKARKRIDLSEDLLSDYKKDTV